MLFRRFSLNECKVIVDEPLLLQFQADGGADELTGLQLRSQVDLDFARILDCFELRQVVFDEPLLLLLEPPELLPLELIVYVDLALKPCCDLRIVHGMELLILAEHSCELAHLFWSRADMLVILGRATTEVRVYATVTFLSGVFRLQSFFVCFAVDVTIDVWTPYFVEFFIRKRELSLLVLSNLRRNKSRELLTRLRSPDAGLTLIKYGEQPSLFFPVFACFQLFNQNFDLG